MTDTKESHYQDRADLEAENAAVKAALRKADARSLVDRPVKAIEWLDSDRRTLLGELGEVRADLAEARKSLDALRAAPSAEEIEAWQERAKVWAATALVRDAVALMRRATAAPAQGALREALLDLHAWLCGVNGGSAGSLTGMLRDEAIKRINRILAAAPEAKEPSGVGVPAETRKLVETQFEHCPFCGDGLDTGWECNGCGRDSKPLVDAILSLPTPQPAALDDTRRLERAEADGACWTCGGSGVIERSAQQMPGCPPIYGYARTTCSRCGGTGKLHYVTMEQMRGEEPIAKPRRETVEEEIARLYGHEGHP